MTFNWSLRGIWNFLWNDNSLLSWIISLVIAFIIIKFIFFPILSLIFGSLMPLVVVESGSMHHSGNFVSNYFGTSGSFNLWWNEKGAWYETHTNITKEIAFNWRLRGGLEIGDIVFIYGRGKYRVGDIIVFNGGQNHPIIHRIIEVRKIGNETIYMTKGDNNEGQLVQELQISKSQILGKAIFKLPKLGWVKLGLVKFVILIR
jgi:signal peptidase I